MKQAIDLMKVFAEDLKNELPNLNINHLSSKISNCIYNACRNSYEKRSPPNPTIQPKLSNCNSKHFRAIANANMTRYITLIESNISNDNINEYLDNWMKFEKLAVDTENKEINSRVNTSWKNCRYDGKKLWDMVDWNDKLVGYGRLE